MYMYVYIYVHTHIYSHIFICTYIFMIYIICQVVIPGTGPALVTVPEGAQAGQYLDVHYPLAPSPTATPGSGVDRMGNGGVAGRGGHQVGDRSMMVGNGQQGGGRGRGGGQYNSELKSVSILLPSHFEPGQQLQVEAGRDTVMFAIPPGAVPGQRISVRYTPSIQSHQVHI